MPYTSMVSLEFREQQLRQVIAERDEAREWARNLLRRCELEHWTLLRAASWQKDDEDLIAELTAERDKLREALSNLGGVCRHCGGILRVNYKEPDYPIYNCTTCGKETL